MRLTLSTSTSSLPDSSESSPIRATSSGDVFASAVSQAAVAAGRDDTHPVLTGVRVEIEGVRLTTDGAELRVIGNTRPVGICGSGIVDAIAELRRTGLINERGRLRRDAPGVRQGRDSLEFVLVAAAETGSGTDIVVTQGDINENQLAKGAIHAGAAVGDRP